jgi:NitT/TauT family transport system substrate-binding protein
MRRFVDLLLFATAALVASSASADSLTLALNWKAEPQFGGFYAARTSGAYAKNGIDVTIIEGGSGTPTIQVLGAGKVDYAIVSADEVVISHDRGAKNVVALFATYQTNPQGIMTHKERGFASLEQVLKSDGTLLWQAGLPYAQFLTKKYGPLVVKTAPYLGGIGNFRTDPHLSQQCFVTSEPLAARRAGLDVETFLVAQSGYNPYTTVLVTTRDHLARSPDEVKRFVTAVRAGWQAYLDDPAPTNAVMAQLNKAMDPQTFRDSAAAQIELIRTKDITTLGEMSLARWQTLIDQLAELKIIKGSIDAQALFVGL